MTDVSADRDWKPRELSPQTIDTVPGAAALLDSLRGLDLEALLSADKALILRDFAVTPAELDEVLDALLPDRIAYVRGNSPRTKVGHNLYTSTEYPAELAISMHNEMSYAAQWPVRLAFYCEKAPESGGATPVIDGELWLELIDPEVRDAFSGGVRYLQNLHGGVGLGKSWAQTFETADRARIEELLAAAAASWEWRADGGLRVEQVRPATIRHPLTGTEVWFNQADQWHPAGLGDLASRALTRIMATEDLPQSVTFANGEAIPDEYITRIGRLGLEAAVDVDWRPGDLLLIDNVLVGHGRRPFTGPRRILVAMSGAIGE